MIYPTLGGLDGMSVCQLLTSRRPTKLVCDTSRNELSIATKAMPRLDGGRVT